VAKLTVRAAAQASGGPLLARLLRSCSPVGRLDVQCLSRLRFRWHALSRMRRACKQSAAGTPFEDSGRAT